MNEPHMRISTALMTVLQATVLGVSGLMCLSDAYTLNLPFWETLAVCAGLAALFVLCLLPRRTWPLTLGRLVIFLGVLLWQHEALEQSLGFVLYRITDEFSQCYDNVQIVGLEEGSAVWLLWAAAVPLIWVPTWVCGREGSAVLVLLIYAPILVLVLTIVDLAPVFWLILLTGGLLVLLLTQYVREQSANEGARLAWWLVLPTVILLCAVTVLWPPADYERPLWSQQLQELVEGEQTGEQVLEQILPTPPRWNEELKTVDLRREGPKLMTGLPVLDYRADTQLSYLRGTSLAVYEDNRWKALDEGVYERSGFDPAPLLSEGNADHLLEIETRQPEPLLYTAYVPARIPPDGRPVDDAYIQNEGHVRAYTVNYGGGTLSTMPAGYGAFAEENYLQIPEELRGPLEALAVQEGLTNVQQVENFVRSCAVYDLMTPRVPRNQDFVLYFLQESHRGYCVHFASSAVLLLRTIGIPARYVTGFAVSGPPEVWQTVTQDEAHAWVEYFDPSLGWVPMDPTPAAQEPEELPPPTEPEPPAPPAQEPPEPNPPREEKPLPEAPAPKHSWNHHLLWLLTIPGLWGLVLLRRLLVCRRRKERCTQARPNRRVLTYWRWLVQLQKVQGKVPPEELFNLAEKARFSQHTMTDEELEQFRLAVEEQIRALQQEPLHRRLWYRYGLTLY